MGSPSAMIGATAADVKCHRSSSSSLSSRWSRVPGKTKDLRLFMARSISGVTSRSSHCFLGAPATATTTSSVGDDGDVTRRLLERVGILLCEVAELSDGGVFLEDDLPFTVHKDLERIPFSDA